MVEIAADDQNRMGDASFNEEIPLQVTINEGVEIPPDPISLVSAGLHFKVIQSDPNGRTLSLRLLKTTRK